MVSRPSDMPTASTPRRRDRAAVVGSAISCQRLGKPKLPPLYRCDCVSLLSDGTGFLVSSTFNMISRQTTIESILRKAEKDWKIDRTMVLRRHAHHSILPDIALLMGNDEYSVREQQRTAGCRSTPYQVIICRLLLEKATNLGWISKDTGMATKAFFDSLGSKCPPLKWETYTR